MNLTVLLGMSARAHQDRTAFGPRSAGVSYRDLYERAGRGADWLRDHQVERLVYLAPNDEAFPVALFAAAWAGVPFVPLSYRLAEQQLADVLRAQPAGVAVVADASMRGLIGACGRRVLDTDAWMQAVSSTARRDPGKPGGDTAAQAVVLYTSGTTSRPKAAVLRHQHLANYVLNSVPFSSATEDEAAVSSVPPYHVAGVCNVLTSVYAGRRVVQLREFSPAAWLETVRDESVTHALLVPTMLVRIVEQLEATGAGPVPTLRSLAYGGARMPTRVLRRALELFPGADFVNAYGLTETSSTIAVLGADDHRLALSAPGSAAEQRLGSAGKLVPGVEVEVRDGRGQVLPAGTPGEIFVRGPQVSGEYLEQGSALDAEGWFATRDRGHLDAGGYLFVEGRSDDTIIRGAENIAPEEVEDVLLRHPAVLEAAVVGIPDEEWGQRVAAVVVPRPGEELDVAALQAFCRQHLRSTRTPDAVRCWRGQLPRTDTGKLVRRRVLELFHAQAPGAGHPR